jgi:hypothetical protein
VNHIQIVLEFLVRMLLIEVVIILFQFNSILIYLRDNVNSPKANRKVSTNKENKET